MFLSAPRFTGEKLITPGPGAYNPKDWTGPVHVLPATDPTAVPRRATSIIPRPMLSSVPAVRQKQLEKMIDTLEEQLRVKDLELLNVETQITRQSENAKSELEAEVEKTKVMQEQQMRLLETQEQDKKKILELTNARVEVQRKVDEKESLVQHLKAQIAESQQTLQELRHELEVCVEEKSKMSESLRANLQEVNDQLERVRRDARHQCASLQNQITESARTRQEIEKEKAELEINLETLRKEATYLKALEQDCQTKLTERERQIALMTRSAQDRERQWTEQSEAALTNHRQAVATLKSTLAGLNAELQSEKQQAASSLEATQTRMGEMEAELQQVQRNAEANARTLHHELELAAVARRELESSKQQLEQHLSELMQQLKASQKEVSSLQSKAQQTQSHVDSLVERSRQREVQWEADVEQLNAEHRGTLQSMRTEHAAMVETLQSQLEVERATSTACVEEMGSKIERVNAELAAVMQDASAEILGLKHQIEAGQQLHSELQSERDSLKSMLNNLQLTLSETQREVGKLTAQNQKSDQMLRGTRETLAEKEAQWQRDSAATLAEHEAILQNERTEAEQKTHALQSAMEKLHGELTAELERVKEEGRKQSKALQKQLKHTESLRQKLEQEKEVVEAQCRELDSQLGSSQQETVSWTEKAHAAERRVSELVARGVELEEGWTRKFQDFQQLTVQFKQQMGTMVAQREQERKEAAERVETLTAAAERTRSELQLALEDQKQAAKEQSDAHSQEVQAMMHEKRELQIDVENLESQVDVLLERVTDHQKEITSLTEQQAELEEEIRKQQEQARERETAFELAMQTATEKHLTQLSSLTSEHEREVAMMHQQLEQERDEGKQALGRLQECIGELKGQLAVAKSEFGKQETVFRLQISESTASCEKKVRELQSMERAMEQLKAQVGEAQQASNMWAAKAMEAQRAVAEMVPKQLKREEEFQRSAEKTALRHAGQLDEMKQEYARALNAIQTQAEKEVSEMKESAKSLRAAKDTAESALDATRKETATQCALMQHQVETACAAREAADLTSEKLRKQVDDVTEELTGKLMQLTQEKEQEIQTFTNNFMEEEAAWKKETEALQTRHEGEIDTVKREWAQEVAALQIRLESERDETRERLDNLRVCMEQVKADAGKRMGDFKEQHKSIVKNLEDKGEQTRKAYEEKLKDLKSQMDRARREAESAITQLQAQLGGVSKQADSRIALMEKERDQADKEVKSLKAKLTDATRALKEKTDETEGKNKEMKRDLGEALGTVARQDKVIKALEKKLWDLGEKHKEEGKQSREDSRKADQLAEEVKTQAVTITQLNAELAKVNAQLTQAREALSAVDMLEVQKMTAQVEAEGLKAAVAQSQHELEMAMDEVKRADDLKSQLAGHVNHKQKIHLHEKLKEENTLLKREQSRIRVELKSVYHELKARESLMQDRPSILSVASASISSNTNTTVDDKENSAMSYGALLGKLRQLMQDEHGNIPVTPAKKPNPNSISISAAARPSVLASGGGALKRKQVIESLVKEARPAR